MYITMTSSKGTPEQLHEAEEFLSGFLPLTCLSFYDHAK